MQGRVVEFVHSAIPLFFCLRGIFSSSFVKQIGIAFGSGSGFRHVKKEVLVPVTLDENFSWFLVLGYLIHDFGSSQSNVNYIGSRV